MNREGRNKVPAKRFYSEWHGHRVEHLEVLLPYLREASDSLIWTAGDSSLDNKYWYAPYADATLTNFVTFVSSRRRGASSSCYHHFPHVIGSMIRNQLLESIVTCLIHQRLSVMWRTGWITLLRIRHLAQYQSLPSTPQVNKNCLYCIHF